MPEENAPLILLPGMGATERMFFPLRDRLPQLITPAWIEPHRGEALTAYARRLARSIDPGCPCYVGGASFGGVVALEMAAALNARACFLIGSMRSPDGLPWKLKVLRPVAPMIGVVRWAAPWLSGVVGATLGPCAKGVLLQFAESDAMFLRWAAGSILSWRPSPEVSRVRIHQIHGDRDRVFPLHLTRPDCVVKGAGHVLSMTHPTETSEFLAAMMHSET